MKDEVYLSDNPDEFLKQNRGALEKALKKKEKAAEKILSDDDKITKLLNKMEKILLVIKKVLAPTARIPIINNAYQIIDDIPKLIWLVRDYKNKLYKDIPYASIIFIIAAFIYTVSPIDLIPDAIPIVGWIDDIGVFAIVLGVVSDDLADYWQWHQEIGIQYYKVANDDYYEEYEESIDEE